MKLSNNTILITGGSSGIGLELCSQLSKDNKIIICGSSRHKLDEAKKLHPQIYTLQCDLIDKKQCADLIDYVKKNHPDINVLINNAAIVHKTQFLKTPSILKMMEAETALNFFAPIRLISGLHPILSNNQNAAIINITTGLVYTPRADYPFYNATKAALHSFTQVFRKQTENSNVEIIEVLFPAVDTPWHKGNPPKIAISVVKAVSEMLKGLQKQKPEIRIAEAKLLYFLSRIAPKIAFNKVNSLKD